MKAKTMLQSVKAYRREMEEGNKHPQNFYALFKNEIEIRRITLECKIRFSGQGML